MSLVMVIDDMAVIREPIAASLRSHGYATLCVGDGKKALDLIRSSPPHVILLDLSMPGMDGIAVLRALRSDPATVKTPVILLTASADKTHVVEAAKLGVKDYILKTAFSLPQLLERVRKYAPPDENTAPPASTLHNQAAAPSAGGSTGTATQARVPTSKPKAQRLTRDQTLERITACTQAKTLPGFVTEIMAMVNSPRGDAADLAGMLKRDPVLASRVLQLANSAAFASEKPRITTIEEAVRNVGMVGVRNILLSVGIFESFRPDDMSTLKCWQHSFAVASIMEKLATASGTLSPGVAYLTGLFHELAEILLGQHFAAEQAAVTELIGQTGHPRWQAEAVVFGLPYYNLVGVLLGQLGLPRAIAEPIEEFFAHSSRKDAGATESGLARALRMANVYAHGLMLAPTPDAPVTPLTTAEYRKTMGSAEPLKLDDRAIRDEVLVAVNTVTGLSSADAARLCTPLIKKSSARLGYFRQAGYCAFDPLATLLGFSAEIDVATGLPDQSVSTRQFKGVVVAGERTGNTVAAQREVLHIVTALGPQAVPTLYLCGTPIDSLELPPWITAANLPVPLDKLVSHLGSLVSAGSAARGGGVNAA